MAKKAKGAKKPKYNNPNRKTRSYLQIVYVESAPQNFVDILKAEVDNGKLRYFILSPLHDKCWYTVADEADYKMRLALRQLEAQEVTYPVVAGSYKKPHWHLIAELSYNSQQYLADRYLRGLTNGSFVKPREDLRGAVRYLAHLDENPKQKALYDPDQIYVYGDIKIDRFLESEDKSMNSLTAWYAIEDLIDQNGITNYYDFEKLIRKQDIDLQLQFQKNARLANRVVHYINSKAEQEHLQNALTRVKMLERQVARKDIDRLVEQGIVTHDYAQKEIKSIYAQIEGS